MSFLATFWTAMAVHLWQSTLVLAALALLAGGLRRAPAAAVDRLWTLGLVKLFLPLGVFGAGMEALLRGLGFRGVAPETAASAVLAPVAAVLDPGPGLRIASGGTAGGVLVAFTAIWLGGTVWILARLLRDLGHARALPTVSPEALPAAPRRRLAEALERAGIPADRVAVAAGEGVPAVVGFLRPRILVPRRVLEALDRSDLQAILLHEDAHRRRRDPLRALAGRLALALLWFYPLLGFLLARLRDTAEFACDEGALRAGVPAPALAGALARTVRLGLAPVSFVPAAENGDPSLLRRRFQRLDHSRRYVFMKRHLFPLAAAALLVAAVSFFPLAGCSTRDAGKASVSAPAQEPAEVAVVPTHTVAPDYPEAVKEAGGTGLVQIQITVGADGSVTEAKVVKSAEGWPALDEAALAAARQWTFQPPETAPAQAVIPFKFALDGDGAGK